MGKQPGFFRISKLPPYRFGEIAQAVRQARLEGRDIIDLSHVNPNLELPAHAVDRLVQACLQPHNHRYSSSQGIGRLRSAAARWYNLRYSVELDSETEIVACMGSKEGLTHLLLSVLSPGDSVMVPTPAYPIHTSAVFLAGACLVGLPLFADAQEAFAQEFLLTEHSHSFFGRLEETFQGTWPRPKMMIVSFPHNPTTATVTLGFWRRLVEYCRQEEIFLVHDFAYADIRYGADAAPSVLQVDGAKEIAVECYSLSKGFGLAGWRVAFIAGSAELVAALKRIKGYIDFGLFQPLQIGAAHLLEQPKDYLEDYLQEVTATYRSRLEVLAAGLSDLGWKFCRPRGSVFLWAQLPERFEGSGSVEVCRRLLQEADVAACPGSGFDSNSDRFVRYALVEPEHRMRQALTKLEAVA